MSVSGLRRGGQSPFVPSTIAAMAPAQKGTVPAAADVPPGGSLRDTMLKSRAAVFRVLALMAVLGTVFVDRAAADVLVSTYYGYGENQFGVASVQRYDETTGQLTSFGQIYDSQLTATGIAQGPDGSIYVSNKGAGRIDHYAIDGSPLGVFATLPGDPNPSGPGTVPASPAALHFGPDGNLYVSDFGGSTIQRYNINTGILMNNVMTGFVRPGGFTFAPNGSLYANDFANIQNNQFGRVVRTSANLQTTTDVTPNATGGSPYNFITTNFNGNSPDFAPFVAPDGILIAPNGNVLVSDLGGNSVLSFESTGHLFNDQSVPPSQPQGQTNYPGGMALDRSGNVLLAVLGNDFSNSGTVLRYDTNGNQIGTMPFISNIPGASDLILVSAQTNWNFNGGGNYSDMTKWDPQAAPSGVGVSAVFGDGTTATVIAPTATVTIDGAYTVGSLLFINSSNTQFTLATDGVAGHGVTLNNGGIGAAVNVTSGNHFIAAPLTLADSGGTTFYVASGSVLSVSSGIAESGGSQSLNKSGEGALVLTGSSSYTGGTTVSNGSLVLRPSGSAASLAPNTTVKVWNTAMLELAGSVSALGSVTTNPIAVINNSAAASGVLVSGTNQQAGGIDGTGTTMVEAGSDLTVGHIVQGALVIGGTATSTATVTIAPYSPPPAGGVLPADSTAGTGGLGLASSLEPSEPFAAGDVAVRGLTAAGSLSFSSSTSLTAFGASSVGSGLSAVPEPSAIFLTLWAACGLLGYGVVRRSRVA
jgi:autotransporter-associated beta strand protein